MFVERAKKKVEFYNLLWNAYSENNKQESTDAAEAKLEIEKKIRDLCILRHK